MKYYQFTTLVGIAICFLIQFAAGAPGSTIKGPPGMVFPFAGSSCPAGSVLANGAAVSRTAVYQNLFTAIGTTWGVGNGSSTYNLPDLRNRDLRGVGTNSDGHGGTSVSLGSYQADETAVNSLALNDPGHAHLQTYHTASGADNNSWPVSGGTNASLSTAGAALVSTSTTGITISGGSETRTKAYGVTYCIWY